MQFCCADARYGVTELVVDAPWSIARYAVDGDCLFSAEQLHLNSRATNAVNLGLVPGSRARVGVPTWS